MQGPDTTEISPAEWRWVFIVGGLLAAVTLLPYAWALALNATATDWQFMGILANPLDGATYLVKINQGIEGAWLLRFLHTPEPHAGAVIFIFYMLLGHLARLIGMSSLVMFHLARVVTTLFMFTALYQFGATVWSRIRPRRIFFGLVSVGSGLGWLATVLVPSLRNLPDFTVPEAYPLFAAYTNPHFPLVIGCLALLAAQFVTVFRIDHIEEPAVGNGGLAVLLLTLVLSLVLPQALIPLGGALVLYLVAQAIRTRRLPTLELRWISMVILPAILMATYYYAVVVYNPVMSIWNSQVTIEYASPIVMIVGMGLLRLVALPGVVRAIRFFEQDGDRLMIMWLLANLLLVFLPTNFQRRFMTGFIIPTVFFAVRSIEDYWFVVLPEQWRAASFIALMVFVIPSNVLAMGVPLYGLVNEKAGLEQRLLLEDEYRDAILWLGQHGEKDAVVLASPNVSLWIPANTHMRVVYGHPYETLASANKLALVEAWYQGSNCDGVLDRWSVRYVLMGPQETLLSSSGESTCVEALAEQYEPVLVSGSMRLFDLGS